MTPSHSPENPSAFQATQEQEQPNQEKNRLPDIATCELIADTLENCKESHKIFTQLETQFALLSNGLKKVLPEEFQRLFQELQKSLQKLTELNSETLERTEDVTKDPLVLYKAGKISKSEFRRREDERFFDEAFNNTRAKS